MLLNFDSVVYQKTWELSVNKEPFTFEVKVTDEESLELDQLLNLMQQGESTGERLEEIMFKDALPKIKDLLIGVNFLKFEIAVIDDYRNFIRESIDEATKRAKKIQ